MATKKREYNQQYEIPASITSAIKKEVKSMNADLLELVENQKAEIASLKAQIKISKNEPEEKLTNVVKDVFSKLPEEGFDQIFSRIYNKDFNEVTKGGWHSAPTIFTLHVNYYTNRFKIYKFFDEVGIKYEPWLKQVILPHEWTKDQLFMFLDTISNHYNCNGQTYSDNLGYWYGDQGQNLVYPEKQMKKNYSEIPWQFLLRNPLWKEDDLFSAMLKKLSDDKCNSNIRYFAELPRYCDIKPDQIISMLKVAEDNGFKRLFQIDKVKSAAFESKDSLIRNRAIALVNIERDFPMDYQKQYIKKLKFTEAISYVHNSPVFTETEKAAMISKIVDKQYSQIAIAERVMEDD